MALLRTVPWNSQPQGPVDIGGFNPVFVFLGSSSVDLVTRKSLTQVNGSHIAIRSPNISGIGFKPGGGAPYASGFHVLAKQAFILSEGASLVWVGTITQTDATYSVIASRWSSSADSSSYAGQWRLEISSTNEVRIAIRADGGVTTTINSGLTVTAGRYTTISVKMLSSSIVFTVNGIESEQSATPQTSAGSGNNVNISIGTTSAGGYNGHKYSNCALLYGLIGNKPSNPWQIFKPIPRIIFAPVSAGGDAIIAATLGTATASGYQASISASSPVTIAGNIGQAAASGLSATLAQAFTLSANRGTATASGAQSTIAQSATISASLGTATASGLAAGISAAGNVTISCNLGTASAAGSQANIGDSVTVSASRGTATAAGYTAALEIAFTLAANRGTAQATGKTATIYASDVISASMGQGIASGYAALIVAGEIYARAPSGSGPVLVTQNKSRPVQTHATRYSNTGGIRR